MCISFMDNIAKTCVKVVSDPRVAEQTKAADKFQVGAFLKSVVASHAQACLSQLEGLMDPDEKEQLAKYMQ